MRTSRLSALPILVVSSLALAGCGAGTSYVKSDTALGRVVVYRNGIAYFERFAKVDKEPLRLSVPADKVDDFLKSLTVVDAKTGEPPPISYPTSRESAKSGIVDMEIRLSGSGPRELKLTYVTEAPAWKPSYRVVVGDGDLVRLQGWAIIDNTSGEDWSKVKLGVGASSALAFRYDLRSVRLVEREMLQADDLFALAPPLGGATHGALTNEKRVLTEIGDDAIKEEAGRDRGEYSYEFADDGGGAVAAAQQVRTRPGPTATGSGRAYKSAPGDALAASGSGAGYGSGGEGGPTAPSKAAPKAAEPSRAELERVARLVASNKQPVVIEGFADAADSDKRAASLDRAHRVRNLLIGRGVSPEQVVAVGNGEVAGQRAGVRIVQTPAQNAPATTPAKPADAASAEPLGTSHFESTTAMDVPRGTSAMVSILNQPARGRIVYLYDPESPRGSATFPFRSIRIENPTDSTLESGPVTVFGSGKFIGEGLAEPIPAHAVGFVPFALDRQIVVDRDDGERDEIERVLSVQRGVFHTEVRHTRSKKLTFTNRLPEAAAVYVRHTVAPGYVLGKSPPSGERFGAAHLFRIEVAPKGKTEVVIEEATPLTKTTDIRTAAGMDMIKVYLSSAAAEGTLKTAVDELLTLNVDMANLEQRIRTTREQMDEYRSRVNELHAQIVTLKLVKTAGPLMTSLEKKMQQMSDRLSRATIELVGHEEKLMLARIRFQDGVAELSLDRRTASAPAEPGTI